jgi:hypothetical protein
MNFSEIKQLLDAGFTRDDILTLAGAAPEPAPASDPEPAPASDPEPASEPEPAPAPADDAIKALTASVAALSKTVADMQKANAKAAEGGKAEPMTADDVIKSFFGK